MALTARIRQARAQQRTAIIMARARREAQWAAAIVKSDDGGLLVHLDIERRPENEAVEA